MKILSQNLAHGMLAWLDADARRRKLAASYEALDAFLRESPADVVCVQELADDARFDLPNLPHVHRVSARGMAVAIASRFPLESPSGAPFTRSGVGKAVAWATVRDGQDALRVGSMHLAVLSPFARRKQLMEAVAVADARGLPTFLVGDTNEPRARVFESWSREHGLTTREPGASFPRGAPALRLDRALVTSGARVTESSVVNTKLSDHRAVTFEVAAV